jgi:hypothetical protein
MPAIAASMFATATNITNIHNKTSIMHINQSIFDLDVYIQGSLTEREGSVQLASLYLVDYISSFLNGNIIFLFDKTSYLNEEVNCTEPSPSVRIPCYILNDNEKYVYASISFYMMRLSEVSLKRGLHWLSFCCKNANSSL